MPIDDHERYREQQTKLIDIVRQLLKQDEALRDKYEVKSKFRFVADRLQGLLANLEQDLQQITTQVAAAAEPVVAADEKVVYVHLFNAHGHTVGAWQNMLIPKVFYEYSVNRPIYAKKDLLDQMIKAKANKTQHGYLMIAVKEADIVKPQQGVAQKDSYGNEVIKVKEGSLHFSRLIAFVHNEIRYSVNEKGELLKKT